jgi:dTDP-4-amino-4,6-dideoxygalactose transaminase
MSRDAWHRFGDEGFVHYDIVGAGYKYNMTDLQAALGIHQLPRIQRYWERRAVIDARYREALRGLPLTLPPPEAPNTRHAHHLFPIQIDVDVAGVERDEFIARMHHARIGVGVHYRALHLHSYYRERFGYERGSLPAAERIGDRTVSLPLSPGLSDRDVDDVVEAAHASLAAP